jgi:hypothetical protein
MLNARIGQPDPNEFDGLHRDEQWDERDAREATLEKQRDRGMSDCVDDLLLTRAMARIVHRINASQATG